MIEAVSAIGAKADLALDAKSWNWVANKNPQEKVSILDSNIPQYGRTDRCSTKADRNDVY